VPTYSYACTECSNRFDIVQSFTDDTLTVCSECSGKLRKLFNSVGIVFKGSGFYRTDSRGSGGTASEPAKSDSSASSTPAGSPSTSPSTSTASAGATSSAT
jgi:putative FmdB family regulatory protein